MKIISNGQDTLYINGA